ncbi:Putative F-box protein At1g32420 [Linum grandiflorum]
MAAEYPEKPHVCEDLDGDLVVTEILSRLPAKSLMRFKSACKSWKSIMEQDSHFINLHRTHSQARPPRMLAINHNRTTNKESSCFELFSADLDYDVRGASIGTVMSVRAPSPNVKVLGPVRGLLCFFDVDNSDVLIYNVSTGQAVTPWIRSSMKQLPLDKSVCELGFDPDTGEYKVILVGHGSIAAAACEVLTVGVDDSWRIINAVISPRCKLFALVRSYANGSIYWMYYNKLLAFDIGSEKFRTIKIPVFTLSGDKDFQLTELDGCLTVVFCDGLDGEILKLWKFHDRNKKGTSYTTAASEDWTVISIKLPVYIDCWSAVFLYPIPGRDQIIVEDFESACFYSYNMVNKTFSEFEIRGLPSLPGHSRIWCELFVEEDLFPAVEKKTSEDP